MSEPRIGIIILAAGGSQRMGTPKQLLRISGVPLVRRAVQAAVGSGCDPVVVVLGANAGLISPVLRRTQAHIAFNSRWRTGMSTSIRRGITVLLTVTPHIEAAVIMVADQPEVTADSLRHLTQEYQRRKAGLVASHFDGVFGTPALFSRQYFPELMRLEGKTGARTLLERYREMVVAVELPEAGWDLDTPDDFAAFTARTRNIALHLAYRPTPWGVPAFPWICHEPV